MRPVYNKINKFRPSTINPGILLRMHIRRKNDGCGIEFHYTIHSESPIKEAHEKFEADKGDRQWTCAEIEDWIRVNFPLS